MPDAVLETKDLSKRFGARWAVRGVNLRVQRGEAYGFLGPNGAGKTTVMRMILGLATPTDGAVKLFGEPVVAGRAAAHERIGVVCEVPALYVDMTAAEYLTFFARLYGVHRPGHRARQMLERFGLADAAGKTLRAFSQGMQQRVNLARAFIHDPELLMLDEPVAGLDPRWIKELRDMLQTARGRGRTVFLSSHLLSIVEKVCDKVAIINAGRLLAEERMDRITGALGSAETIIVEVAAPNPAITRALSGLPFVKDVSTEGSLLKVRADPVENIRERIAAAATAAGGTVLMVKRETASLEEAFLELTERNVALLTRR